ncbi:MAG: amino acid permease, partial [Candidatus Angelobacter sp.]|nr:amino acid permease [Candidatus Angelobacter sp.]
MIDREHLAVRTALNETEEVPIGAAEGLQRRLSQRQLTMMAIGGAIGVGLFLGSSVTIRLAGPAVIISYLLGAA